MEFVFMARVANFKELTDDDLLTYLLKDNEEVEYYEFQREPNVIYNSAGNWEAISGVAGILSVVLTLWQIYQNRIQQKKDKESNAGIILNVNVNGKHNSIWIGGREKDQKAVLEKIQKILEGEGTEVMGIEDKVKILRNSKRWKKLK